MTPDIIAMDAPGPCWYCDAPTRTVVAHRNPDGDGSELHYVCAIHLAGDLAMAQQVANA